MRGRFRWLVLLIIAMAATGQPTTEQINTGNSCSYAGEPPPTRVMAFASDSDAESAVKKIVEASGLAQNFQIRAAGVNNAAAAMTDNKRYLLYNQTFMRNMEQATGSQWAALSVLAHEVGHHLNNHTLLANRDPRFEIEADYYSGFILQKLGATLADAQAAVNYLPMSSNSKTHPAKHDRLAAIANGWTKSCNDTGCNRRPAPELTAKPGPKPVEDGPNSCEYANNGECDEPGICKRGTDTSDCRKRPAGPNSCEYARDDSCDEPDLCDRGTDTADCRSKPKSAQLYCCDGWGRKWCPILVNPGAPGTPCWCAGVPGSGFMCE